jgi:hypothetical protein
LVIRLAIDGKLGLEIVGVASLVRDSEGAVLSTRLMLPWSSLAVIFNFKRKEKREKKKEEQEKVGQTIERKLRIKSAFIALARGKCHYYNAVRLGANYKI